MVQTGDIVRVTHQMTYLGQEVLNVFFWEIGSMTLASDTFATFANDYMARFELLVLGHLSEFLVLDNIHWENLTDGVEIGDLASGNNGNDAIDPMPSSVALGVILRRTTKLTRNGYKRFPGLTEDKVSGNAQGYSGLAIIDIESWCGVDNTYTDYDGAGSDVTLEPVIVGRTKDAFGNYQIDLAKINPVLTAQVKSTVTTQNTRKP